MDELKPDPTGESLVTSIREFMQDWRKGDFELPNLAQLDAQSIESALENWLANRPPETPAIGPEVTQADRDCLHTMGIPASADDLAIVAAHRIQSTAALAQGDATDKDYIVDIDHKGNFYNVPLSEWNKGNKP